MANVISFTYGTFSGLGSPLDYPSNPYGMTPSGAHGYKPRGIAQPEFSGLTDGGEGGGGGADRPEFGQIWPRGNTRGNA